MKMPLLVTSTLVAVLVLGGCRSHNLSRDEAKHLIASSEKFTAPATREILLGPDGRRGTGDFLNNLMGTFDFELAFCLGADDKFDPLVTPRVLARSDGEVVLTDEGKKAEKDWGMDPERPNGRFVPVAQAELLEAATMLLHRNSPRGTVLRCSAATTTAGGSRLSKHGSFMAICYLPEKCAHLGGRPNAANPRPQADGNRASAVPTAYA